MRVGGTVASHAPEDPQSTGGVAWRRVSLAEKPGLECFLIKHPTWEYTLVPTEKTVPNSTRIVAGICVLLFRWAIVAAPRSWSRENARHLGVWQQGRTILMKPF